MLTRKQLHQARNFNSIQFNMHVARCPVKLNKLSESPLRRKMFEVIPREKKSHASLLRSLFFPTPIFHHSLMLFSGFPLFYRFKPCVQFSFAAIVMYSYVRVCIVARFIRFYLFPFFARPTTPLIML